MIPTGISAGITTMRANPSASSKAAAPLIHDIGNNKR
jgi:hypothetical protein